MSEPEAVMQEARGLVQRDTKSLSTSYVAPRTELEQWLADLWSARLGVTPVGIDDDFFELGGHSLAAAELLVEIAKVTGTEVSATTLFLEPSVSELAVAIESASGSAEGGH